MAKFYGTFGWGQSIGGKSVRNYYVVIVASCYEKANRMMSEQYGQNWSMLYTEGKEGWNKTSMEIWFPDGEYARFSDKTSTSIARMKKRKYDKVCKVNHGNV